MSATASRPPVEDAIASPQHGAFRRPRDLITQFEITTSTLASAAGCFDCPLEECRVRDRGLRLIPARDEASISSSCPRRRRARWGDRRAESSTSRPAPAAKVEDPLPGEGRRAAWGSRSRDSPVGSTPTEASSPRCIARHNPCRRSVGSHHSSTRRHLQRLGRVPARERPPECRSHRHSDA